MFLGKESLFEVNKSVNLPRHRPQSTLVRGALAKWAHDYSRQDLDWLSSGFVSSPYCHRQRVPRRRLKTSLASLFSTATETEGVRPHGQSAFQRWGSPCSLSSSRLQTFPMRSHWSIVTSGCFCCWSQLRTLVTLIPIYCILRHYLIGRRPFVPHKSSCASSCPDSLLEFMLPLLALEHQHWQPGQRSRSSRLGCCPLDGDCDWPVWRPIVCKVGRLSILGVY